MEDKDRIYKVGYFGGTGFLTLYRDYLQKYRLKVSKKLIKEGNVPVSKVAELVGFTDSNYFGRQFRKHFGCTPSQMAKEYNSGNVR